MDTNKKITPDEFAEIEAEYRAAIKRRDREIVTEVRADTQQAVADKWGINYSYVSKIVKKMKRGKGD